MTTVLFHRDSPLPWFIVRGVVDKGRKLEVTPVWMRQEQVDLVYTIDKATYRNYGYYPKEIEDAELPELQTRLRAGETYF
jgi:hypothetical protein